MQRHSARHNDDVNHNHLHDDHDYSTDYDNHHYDNIDDHNNASDDHFLPASCDTNVCEAEQSETGSSPKTSKNRWRALSTATVTNNSGELVKNAEVKVRVRYRIKKDPANAWREDPDLLTGTTDQSGAIPFTSDEYATNGQSVEDIQFVVDSVRRTGFLWTPPTPAESITVTY
ncbi:MAG: hypothetical protein WBA45_00880 [Microthrixaceae bacterium]